MARECRCSCDAFATVVRVVTLFGHLASMVAAGWGFIVANMRFTVCNTQSNGANCAAATLLSLSNNYAIFQGLMAVYFM